MHAYRHGLAALAVVALGGPAQAGGDGVVESAEHQFRLALGADWARISPAPGPEQIIESRVQADTGRTLVVVRMDYPNPDAWRGRRSFFDAVEAGFRSACVGYRRLRVHRGRLQRVPVLDLAFSRERDGARQTVQVRALFFRTYSLVLVITSPGSRRHALRELRAQAAEFRPFFVG